MSTCVGPMPTGAVGRRGAGQPGHLRVVTFYHSPHPTTSPGSLDSAYPCTMALTDTGIFYHNPR